MLSGPGEIVHSRAPRAIDRVCLDDFRSLVLGESDGGGQQPCSDSPLPVAGRTTKQLIDQGSTSSTRSEQPGSVESRELVTRADLHPADGIMSRHSRSTPAAVLRRATSANRSRLSRWSSNHLSGLRQYMQKQFLATPRSPKTSSMSGNLSGVSGRLIIVPRSVSLNAPSVSYAPIGSSASQCGPKTNSMISASVMRRRDRLGVGLDVSPPESAAHPDRRNSSSRCRII